MLVRFLVNILHNLKGYGNNETCEDRHFLVDTLSNVSNLLINFYDVHIKVLHALRKINESRCKVHM